MSNNIIVVIKALDGQPVDKGTMQAGCDADMATLP